MRYRAQLLLTALLAAVLIFCSCSGQEQNPLNAFLGDYSYSAPAVCMVYERVEDELDDDGNPCYGIQYREVNDLEGLMGSGNTFLIYFYSSMSNEGAEVTASMEDVAQLYNGKLTVLMLDAMEYRDLMEKYDIEAVPEFVLVRAGQTDQVFNSSSYGYWTVNDVISWLQSNGIV